MLSPTASTGHSAGVIAMKFHLCGAQLILVVDPAPVPCRRAGQCEAAGVALYGSELAHGGTGVDVGAAGTAVGADRQPAGGAADLPSPHVSANAPPAGGPVLAL